MTEVRQQNLKKFFADWPTNLHGAWLYDFLGLYTFEERSKKNMAMVAILKTCKQKISIFLCVLEQFFEANPTVLSNISKIEWDRDDFMAEIATNSVLHVY